MNDLNISVVKIGGVIILIAKNIQRYVLKMKPKLAFQLKQIKISKYIFNLIYKKSVLKKEITESDLTRLRELIDEQDKLVEVE
jgi:hypothetical protein